MRFDLPQLLIGAGLGALVATTVSMNQRLGTTRKTSAPSSSSSSSLSAAPQPVTSVDVVQVKSSDVLSMFENVGVPTSPVVMKQLNENLVVLYDRRLRVPLWSCERHRPSDVRDQTIDRKDSKFYSPDDEDPLFAATNDDYLHSGFDRGHLAPASAFKATQGDMDSTFNLANIAPQVGVGFNRHFWARFEAMAKRLNKRFDDVYVLTGSAFLPSAPPAVSGERSSVHYDVIGRNSVAVPTHFFKVIVAVGDGSKSGGGKRSVSTAAFLMPNSAIPESTPVESFLVEREVLEAATGIRFFPRLLGQHSDPAQPVARLCDDKSLCQLPPPDWWVQEKAAAMAAAAANGNGSTTK
jgi:DNA/RNA endonuclease G (NUC1)